MDKILEKIKEHYENLINKGKKNLTIEDLYEYLSQKSDEENEFMRYLEVQYPKEYNEFMERYTGRMCRKCGSVVMSKSSDDNNTSYECAKCGCVAEDDTYKKAETVDEISNIEMIRTIVAMVKLNS